jgi:hypothetical protein
MLLGCFSRWRERKRGRNDGEKGEAGGYGEREWGGKKEKKKTSGINSK